MVGAIADSDAETLCRGYVDFEMMECCWRMDVAGKSPGRRKVEPAKALSCNSWRLRGMSIAEMLAQRVETIVGRDQHFEGRGIVRDILRQTCQNAGKEVNGVQLSIPYSGYRTLS
jgi:hypothetical protein